MLASRITGTVNLCGFLGYSLSGVKWAQMLLEPFNQQFPLSLVLMGHQVVLAEVFVAGTLRVALVEAEYLVDGGLRTQLVRHHLP